MSHQQLKSSAMRRMVCHIRTNALNKVSVIFADFSAQSTSCGPYAEQRHNSRLSCGLERRVQMDRDVECLGTSMSTASDHSHSLPREDKRNTMIIAFQ